MQLFIIGNGYDIGYGLPTKYLDFRTYLERVNDFTITLIRNEVIIAIVGNESTETLTKIQ